MPKILIIEDDEKMRNALIEILTEEGYIVDIAENGKVGIDKIKKNHFDMVLTDLIMPVIGGMEVLHEVKKLKPKTLVILITAFATIENAVESMKSGAADYITKPFKIDEIQTKIRKALKEAEFEKNLDSFDYNVIKAISNPIRKDVVELLDKKEKLRFTEIKLGLGIDDPTKLSFHLRVLKSNNLIEQDNDRVYMLTYLGKKLIKSLSY